MKKLLVVLAMLIGTETYAQCVNVCETSRVITDQTYSNNRYQLNSNGCYRNIYSHTKFVNVNGRCEYITIVGKTDITLSSRNRSENLELKTSGTTNLTLTNNNINSNSNLTIYNDGNLTINLQSINSNNKKTITIFTDDEITFIPNNRRFIIKNEYTYKNITFIIKSCGSALPIRLFQFEFQGNTIHWSAKDVETYHLQGSNDGKEYTTVFTTNTETSYQVDGKYKYYRLYMIGIDKDEMLSRVIIAPTYNNSNKIIKAYYNTIGQEIKNIADYKGMYIIQYDDMTSSKAVK